MSPAEKIQTPEVTTGTTCTVLHAVTKDDHTATISIDVPLLAQLSRTLLLDAGTTLVQDAGTAGILSVRLAGETRAVLARTGKNPERLASFEAQALLLDLLKAMPQPALGSPELQRAWDQIDAARQMRPISGVPTGAVLTGTAPAGAAGAEVVDLRTQAQDATMLMSPGLAWSGRPGTENPARRGWLIRRNGDAPGSWSPLAPEETSSDRNRLAVLAVLAMNA